MTAMHDMNALRPDVTTERRRVRPRSPSECLEPGRQPRQPKNRRKRSSEKKGVGRMVRLISGVMTVFAILLLLTGGAVFTLNHAYHSPGPLPDAKKITIPLGQGRLQIASRLESEGIISNRWAFIINHLARSVLSGSYSDMKAGEYRFAARAPMSEVLSTVLSGRSHSYRITFPEGWTSQQIVNRLLEAKHLTGEITSIPGEGTLMPATFRYHSGDNRQEIIDRMREAQADFLAEAWNNRQPNLPISTPQEALILASIVEKETGKAGERAHVASVFINRLRKGMRLQSDPTIIYGIVGGAGSLGRPIYKSDIKKTTPYNTYRINGLPPTPIANPGREAIRAVLNPANTNDLYFVADGTGGHKFSATLKEHNEAVANWRKIEKAARQQARRKAKLAAAAAAAATPPSTPAASELQTAQAEPAAASAATVTPQASSATLLNASTGRSASDTSSRSGVPLPIRAPR